MANEWETKELPRAKGKIAPAQWNADSVQWEPYAGVRKLEQKLNDIDNRMKKIESGETAVNTQLTGSIVEHVMADSEEIRDSDVHVFPLPPIDVLRKLKSFEIYVTDFHTLSTYTHDDSLNLDFAIAQQYQYRSLISLFPYADENNRPFGWSSRAYHSTSVSETRFGTRLLGTMNRYSADKKQSNRYNLSLTQMLRSSQWSFYENYTELPIEVSLEEKNDFIAELKKFVIVQYDETHSSYGLTIKFDEVPDKGDISIIFKGWFL